MKIGLIKSKDEKQETELVIRLNGKVLCEKVTVRKLTILDTTALAVSMMFLPVLFHGMLIERANLQQKQEENQESE